MLPMRLLTRSDFDGLACGAMLKHLGIINRWTFIHPKSLQDGLVEVTSEDVLANVPYVPGCGMWFDHHFSEAMRVGKDVVCPGEYRLAPSAARVIYDYYGGNHFLPHFDNMVMSVDKVDSGDLTPDDILNPQGWVLMGFIMDPRTGLGRFHNFTVSNYKLMEILLDACSIMDIDQLLQMKDVQERIDLYHQHSQLFKEMLLSKTVVRNNVVVTDLRGCDTIYAGNRFMIYSLFPEQNVSVWVVDGKGSQNCVIAVGYSILNRTCTKNVGALMLKHGGGGHVAVGTCQVPYDAAEQIIEDVVDSLQ